MNPVESVPFLPTPSPRGGASEPARRSLRWQNVVSVVALCLAFWLLLRVLLVPDPGGDLLFRRAWRLERQNLIEPAIRQYRLLSDSRPDSPHAPDALWHQGELLTELARAGDVPRFREALAAFTRLASKYRQSELAGRALLRIGALSTTDLHDVKAARMSYERVLREYPNNREFASQATLQLGRVAMQSKDAKGAQRWLQLVLRSYPALLETSAQAQYLLGETYETLWRNPEHMVWARNAYELTISKYPQSVWAGKAKERRASLIYGEVAPLARRVLLSVAPMPDEGSSNGSLFAALHGVLAARGIEADDITLAGWGMEPFYAGFSPDDPSRVVAPAFDAFENAVANAGLAYDELDTGSDAALALKMLQNEIDDARVVLVYTGRWNLVTGYDSGRNRVFLQDRGARRVSFSSAEFVKAWKTKSPRGTSWTMLSFHAPGEIVKLQPNVALPGGDIATGETAPGQSMLLGNAAKSNSPNGLTKTGATGAKANGASATGARGAGLPAVLRNNASGRARVSPQISPLQPPTLLYTLNPLSEAAAYRRALARAAAKMQKPSEGKSLLNVAALRAIASQMKRVSQAPLVDEDAAHEYLPDAQPLENEPPVRSESGAPPEATSEAAASDAATAESPASGSDTSGADGKSEAATPTPAPSAGIVTPDARGKTQASGATANAGRGKTRSSRMKAGEALNAARALLGWRGAPLSRWIAARRQAAGFLDRAATRLKEPALRQAADAFRQSVAALENARAALPSSNALSSDGATLSVAARRDFARAAREIERAAQAEARATDIMSQAGA